MSQGLEQWPLLPRQPTPNPGVVSEGWGIDTDRLGKGLGSSRNRIGPLVLAGHPFVIITGTVGLGSFLARRNRFYERWGPGPHQGPRQLLR